MKVFYRRAGDGFSLVPRWVSEYLETRPIDKALKITIEEATEEEIEMHTKQVRQRISEGFKK